MVTITIITYEYLVFTHCCGWEDRIMRIYDWLYCAVIYHFYWIECCENGATIVPNNQKQPNGMIRMRVYYEIEENNKSILYALEMESFLQIVMNKNWNGDISQGFILAYSKANCTR